MNVAVALGLIFPAMALGLGLAAVFALRGQPAELWAVAVAGLVVAGAPSYAGILIVRNPTLKLASVAAVSSALVLAVLVGLGHLSMASLTAPLMSPPKSLREAAALGAYVGALSSVFLAMMITLVFRTAFGLGRAWKIRSYPMESAFASLGDLLTALLSNSAVLLQVPDSPDRIAGIARLEEAARCFEVGLPRMLRLPGERERAAMREQVQGIAYQLRQWQVALALPSKDGLNAVLDGAAASARLIMLGYYDELPTVNPEPLSAPQRIGALRELLRAIVVAILPVAAFTVAWRLGVPLEGVVGTLAWVTAISWAVVCLIAAVDPAYGSKLTAAREFLDVLQRNR
ncbi:hypothetical protein AB0C42_01785 [Micromonospora taraxaci]|uniref:hypothetical protein n=1 Tax=Micromonospora taraxaci TaxID=1316803 RepID=UPI00340F70F4